MRKQILIFGHDYTTQFIDVFNQYARLFDPARYEVTIAYLTGEPDDAIKSRTLADHVLFLNEPKKSVRSLKIHAIQTMLALTREKRFSMVICHRYKPAYIMMWVARFHRIPTLISVMHEFGTLSSLKRKLFVALFSPKNMWFAGVSNAIRDDLRKEIWGIPKENIVTLYNVIDVDLTEPHFLTRDAARAQLKLNANDMVFGTLGRLVKNKDQRTLIEAFSHIKFTCPYAKLVILGTGTLEDELRAQIGKHHLENEVILPGFLPNGFRYMKAFDCFILTSIQEAFGRVLIEAMLAKCPVIASRVHGIPEVIGGAGTLVSPKEAKQFAHAMQTLYEATSYERVQLGEKSYQRVLDHFSLPQFHRQFWTLFGGHDQ